MSIDHGKVLEKLTLVAQAIKPIKGLQGMDETINEAIRALAQPAETRVRCIDCTEPVGNTAVCLVCADLRCESVANATGKAQPAEAVEGLDFEPDEQHAVADMANVGYSLMKAIARLMPGYAWNESPAEIVGDLLNQIDELRSPPTDAAQGAVVYQWKLNNPHDESWVECDVQPAEAVEPCRCVDCGGDMPGHSTDCAWMKELHNDAVHGAVAWLRPDVLYPDGRFQTLSGDAVDTPATRLALSFAKDIFRHANQAGVCALEFAQRIHDAYPHPQAAPAQGDGWKLVPVKPTAAMLSNIGTAITKKYGSAGWSKTVEVGTAVWRQMLAAAPSPEVRADPGIEVGGTQHGPAPSQEGES